MKLYYFFAMLFIPTSFFANEIPDHAIWNALLKRHVTEDGRVNYKGFISSSDSLNMYLETLSDNPPQPDVWSTNEQKAFWINAYNAFTVKLITQYYPVASIKDIGPKTQIPFVNTTWDIKFIRIGKDTVDLNSLEHTHLRKVFNDPRVHFSLVCASASCPILLNKAYFAETLDEQLDTQTKRFISDKSRNIISENSVQLSKIFDWYAMDFKTKETSVLDFINKYSEVKINSKAEISFLVYSWDLNE